MKCTILIAAALLLGLAATPLPAQDDDDPPRRAAIRSATTSTPPAQPAAATRLTAPDPGGLRYICTSGNCACAGVQDCVDMKDICAPGTMGCNKHGCTCAEGDSGGEDG